MRLAAFAGTAADCSATEKMFATLLSGKAAVKCGRPCGNLDLRFIPPWFSGPRLARLSGPPVICRNLTSRTIHRFFTFSVASQAGNKHLSIYKVFKRYSRATIVLRLFVNLRRFYSSF